MGAAAILAAISAGLALIPSAIEAGASILSLVQKMQKVASSDPNAVTEADLKAIRDENDALAAEITMLEDKSAAGE